MLRTISALVKLSLQGQLVLVSKQSFATKHTSMERFSFLSSPPSFLPYFLTFLSHPLTHADRDRETQRHRQRDTETERQEVGRIIKLNPNMKILYPSH